MKRSFAVVILVSLICLLGGPLPGQEDVKTLAGGAKRLAEAERKINGKEDYWAERGLLEQQAILLAEQDLQSKDAEEVLQWVLGSPHSSPTAMRAAKYLAKYHGASRSTIDWLLNLSPREWSPDLFAAVGQSELSPDERAIVEVCTARHDLALLELSDEIKLSKGGLGKFELRLGNDLANTLRTLDGEKSELQLIDRFKHLADRHGDREIGGVTVHELAGGAIFSIKHLRLGKTAAELAGTSVDGEPIALSQYRNNVVLVDFWATWCAPCVGAMPQLKELKKLHRDKLVILGVNADQEIETVRKFVNDQSINWPTILDPDGKLQKRWLALSLPTYYVLDQDHVVRYRGSSFSQAANAVDAILGNRAVADLVRATLEALDKNDDQRIGKNELPPDKQNVMDTADSNKDGFLSIDELTAFTRANMSTTTVKPNVPDKR